MPFVKKVRRQPNNPLIRGTTPTANERRVLQTYLDAFRNVRGSTINRETFGLIMEQVAAGNPLSAASLIPWGNFAQDLQPFVDVTTAQVVTSANQSLARLPKRLQIDYKFDLTDPRAIAWAQVRAGASIRGITEESRQAVARVISDGLRSKLDMEQMATRIEAIVGLDQRQAKSLDNYYAENLERLMDEGDSFAEATREVRESIKPLYDRMIRYRGLRIARTEMVTAANQGRVLSWFELESQNLMPPDSKRIWITALDERTCSVCAPKHRQTVAWDTDFDFGSPALHPHCRCSIELLPGKPSARIAGDETQSLSGTPSAVARPARVTYGGIDKERLIEVEKRLEAKPPTPAQEKLYGDKILYDLTKDAGFHGTPKVLSGAEFEAVAAKSDAVVYRGVGSRTFEQGYNRDDRFKYGEYYAGRGRYGNGTYTSTNVTTADVYATGRGGTLAKMAIPDTSKFVQYEDLVVSMKKARAEIDTDVKGLDVRRNVARQNNDSALVDSLSGEIDELERIKENFLSDEGKFATLSGYAGIKSGNESESWYIILDRRVLVVKEETVFYDQ